MSYTTQREFFNVPFRNEEPRLPERKRSDGALMTYDLCTDGRAWALDKQKRSNYILDVVHKTRFKKAMLHPDGQFELTKDYLIHLDVDDLAEYILSLQAEIKRKNDSMQQLDETRKTLDKQLEAMQAKSEELYELQQQSEILAEERNDFEQQLEDLEMVIVDLKERADRYDLLAKENASLRDQLRSQRMEAADRIRLINAEVEANFSRMQAEDYEKLEAELVLFKAQYEDLRQQKRDLKEQLQRAAMQQSKMTDLKRQLALEQAHREKVEDELEHLLSLYDQRFQVALDERSLPAIEDDYNRQNTERWVESRRLSTAEEEPRARISSHHSESNRPDDRMVVEQIVERCENCATLQQQLESLRVVHSNEQQKREKESQALKEQYDLLKKDLDLAVQAKDEEVKKREEIQKQQLTQLSAQEAPSKDQPSVSATAEIEALKKTNEELQKEITRLLLAQSGTQDGGIAMAAESQAEMLKTIESLQLELQNANDMVKKKDDECRKMEVEVEKTRTTQQLGVAESAAVAMQEAEQMRKTNDELDQKLRQCAAEMEERKREVEKLNRDIADEKRAKESLLLAADTSDAHDDALKLAEQQSELMKTIEKLRSELQASNDMVKEKEDAVRKMELEMQTMQSAQQLEAAETAAEAMQETQRLNKIIEDLEAKLKECDTELDEQKRNDVTQEDSEPIIDVNQGKDHSEPECEESVPEVSAEAETKLEPPVEEEESMNDGEEDEEIIVEAQQELFAAIEVTEPRVSIKSATGKDEELANKHQEADGDHEEASLDDDGRDQQALIESDTLIEETEDEDLGQEEVPELEDTENIQDDTKKDSPGRETLSLDELTHEQRELLQQNGFLDNDIIRLSTSDPDKTRMIALKIVHHGIDVLLIAELHHLHGEICRAVIERYIKLGDNVKTIDKAMYECHQILDTVKKMGNSEMNSMLASPVTQVPIRNPILLNDEIPVRLPPSKPKSRPKTTGAAGSVKNSSRVLIGDYKEDYKGLFKPSPKKLGKVVVENGDFCRTRPWRAPKTPTETIVASTLVDGSRVSVRQKRHL
nr:myosin-11-like [Aedes albopictus]